MKTERTILELLILLRENIEEYWEKHNHTGLCHYVDMTYYYDIITLSERDKVYDYIFKYRPNKKSSFQRHYWWPRYKLLPRIEFLDKLIKEKRNKMITPEEILKIISNGHGVDWLKNRRRYQELVWPRQKAAFLLREYTSMSFHEIAATCGYQNHATVIYSCRKVRNLCDVYKKYKNEIAELRHKIDERIGMNYKIDIFEHKHRQMLDTDFF